MSQNASPGSSASPGRRERHEGDDERGQQPGPDRVVPGDGGVGHRAKDAASGPHEPAVRCRILSGTPPILDRPSGVGRATLCYAPADFSTLVQEPLLVTGLATGGTERGTRAPSRLPGAQGAVGAVLVVLVVGLVLRLILTRLLPGSGFEVDLNAFRFWAGNLADSGPGRLLRPRLLP